MKTQKNDMMIYSYVCKIFLQIYLYINSLNYESKYTKMRMKKFSALTKDLL